jgi:prostaglandin-endoperoxide synthase 2
MFLLRRMRTAESRRGVTGLRAWQVRLLTHTLPRVARRPRTRRALSRALINAYAYALPTRPRPLSLAADYTSWSSLTDRTYTGRHLDPAPPRDDLPSVDAVVAVFRRAEGQEVKATDTSVLFSFFAQWFTDSFLRTSRSTSRHKNSSTHEIDLCQIYGLNRAQTDSLRGGGGRLKSQLIGPDREEYPPYLFAEGLGGELTIKPEFAGLHRFDALRPFLGESLEYRKHMFAVGLEYGNSTLGHTLLNTLFLREHNRIAGLLEAENPGWDSDRIFETTRNVMIVLELKLVIEEYIRHIAPFDFPLEVVPFIADRERWNRPNRMSIEFDLLYRWHPLVPEAVDFGFGTGPLAAAGLVNANPLVLEHGIEPLIASASRQQAGKIGLRNTAGFLTDVDRKTVELMRGARLRSFNDYRDAFGLDRLTSFDQLTADSRVRDELARLYPGGIDDLEWYVGIFAEGYPQYRMMGALMTTMVAHDAFTQALTNPLLARDVFTENTFTATGMQIITDTRCLQQIVERNSRRPGEAFASFACTSRDAEVDHNAVTTLHHNEIEMSA